jgi:hypothetical protein
MFWTLEMKTWDEGEDMLARDFHYDSINQNHTKIHQKVCMVSL